MKRQSKVEYYLLPELNYCERITKIGIRRSLLSYGQIVKPSATLYQIKPLQGYGSLEPFSDGDLAAIGSS